MAFIDTFKGIGSGNKKGEATTDLLAPKVSTGAIKSDLDLKNTLSKVRIVALDNVTNVEVSTMLMNPNTITEQKSANWAKHYIPGQNDPLLQWISGSERVVSFSGYLTKDKASNPTYTSKTVGVGYEIYFNSELSPTQEIDESDVSIYEGSIINSLAEISAQTEDPITFSAVAGRAADQFTNPFGSSDTVDEDNVPEVEADPRVKYFPLSIQKHLDYYRSLVMPRKSALGGKAKSPTLIKLEMGDILGNREITKNLKWILLDYNITVTKMTPNLIPIEAQVNFTFIEYVDQNRVIDSKKIPKSLQNVEYLATEVDVTPANINDFVIPGNSGTLS